MTVTIDEIEAARTPSGGWTKAQLAAWGVPWPPPKGWKARLLADWLPHYKNTAGMFHAKGDSQ